MTAREAIDVIQEHLFDLALPGPEIEALTLAITALREQEAGKRAVAKTLRDLFAELKEANLEYRDVFSAGWSRGCEIAIKTLARNWRDRNR